MIDSGLVGSTEFSFIASQGHEPEYHAFSPDGKRQLLGGVPREQKMLKGQIPRVIYHRVFEYTKIIAFGGFGRKGAAGALAYQ